MNKIQIMSLTSVLEIEMIKKRINLAMRLTQHGHEINNLDDLRELLNKTNFQNEFMRLSHEVPQKAGTLTIAIVGASRRFLAQITKHHEAFIVSSSLQYSDFSDNNNFCVPYDLIYTSYERAFYLECKEAMLNYKSLTREFNNDTAGYIAPQALRSVILITATIPVWQHIIRQRICKRNTVETRYIMLSILELFQRICPELFPNCRIFPCCQERKLSCHNPYNSIIKAKEILDEEFSKIRYNEGGE